MARDLRTWLEDLGLERCFEIFVTNDVDFDLLLELDDGDLERLGVSFGHRKRLLRAIAELKAAPEHAGPAAEVAPKTAASSGLERRQLTVMFIDLVGLFTGVNLQAGTRVEQLLNGDQTYPRLWADLRSARQTISAQNSIIETLKLRVA